MSLTYTTYVQQLQVLVASTPPDANFDTILPGCIDYAEQRIYRELDLLQTVTVDTSVTTVIGNRNITLPSTIVAVNGINLFAPAAPTRRLQLTPVSRDVVDRIWPGGTNGEPEMFAMLEQWTAILGPPPDNTYSVEIIGTTRPTPLSATNTTTFLTLYLPDLFMAASMVYMSGYQRNFSLQGNDPQAGTSWEQQYEMLFKSANAEELRKKFSNDSWGSLTAGSGSASRG